MNDSTMHFPMQLPMDALPSRLWDVLVVGAGPAGSAAAHYLAQRGLQVLLLDRSRFPRDKACGDALAPDALQALARMDLIDEVRAAGCEVPGLTVFSPSGVETEVDVDFVTLRRRTLDSLLAARAARSGAVFGAAEVQSIATDTNGLVRCQLANTSRLIECRQCIVATGAELRLLDRLGRVERRHASGMAARCYMQSTASIDRLVFSFERSTLPGYRWIFPLGSGLYNVGCIGFGHASGRGNRARRVNLARMFATFLDDFPQARELTAGCHARTPLSGARVRCGLRGVSLTGEPRILAIGESIGSTFSVSGEGIGQALETAELAADFVCERIDRPDDSAHVVPFADRVRKRMGARHRGHDTIEGWLSRAWLNDLVLGRVARSRSLRRAFSRMINENLDPQLVFSWQGLWQSMWG